MNWSGDQTVQVRTSDKGTVNDVIVPERVWIHPGKTGDRGAQRHQANDAREGHVGPTSAAPVIGGSHRDTRSERSRQDDQGNPQWKQPNDGNDTAEHGVCSRELEFAIIRALWKQHGSREGTRFSRNGRPLQPQVERAAVLLVLRTEFVNSRVEPHPPNQRVHVGRRLPPDHQFAIQPNVEAVVACSVEIELTGLREVPVAGPARAEETPREQGIVIQEVEGDVGSDVAENRGATEAHIRKDLSP